MYFFSSSRVKVLETLLKQKPYSPFLRLTNHTEVMTHKKNRPVDKILDLTCPGKQLTIIYLHLISYRTNNSSFYAYFCKTAIVIRYLYISLSSTCEEHGAKPLVSGWLMALCLCHMQPPELGWKWAEGQTPVAAQQVLAASLHLFPLAP